MKVSPQFWRTMAAAWFALMAVQTASALPNLTPYKPTGWSDKIVVARTTGTTTDSTALTTSDTLYVSWAVINNGTNSTGGNFDIDLYVDGVDVSTWISGALPQNNYTYVNDYPIGSLGAGQHTLEIIADSTGVIAESNEADNTYTKTITVNVPVLPNLTPYQPPGWSDKIVVSRTTNSITDSAGLTTADSLYVDWAVINSGNTAATNLFYNALYLDGVFVNSWPATPPLNTNTYVNVTNYAIGSLAAGMHTLEIRADSTGTVAESNEADNSYFKNITVSLLAPALNLPANAATSQSVFPAFNWTAVAGATSYRILVATSAADLPTDPTATSGGPSVVFNATTTTTVLTPSVPLGGATTCYWEVHGVNAGQSGTWSAVYHFTTTNPAGVTIIPTFDSSITGDPQAATIEATINSAIAVYKSAFSNPITVAITFQSVTTGLGQSLTSFEDISYTLYRAALVSQATTADDTTALAHLPAGPNNPVNTNANIALTYPLARALGFSADPGGQPDGTISLYTGIMNLSPAQTNPANYSLFAVVSHEIDEVLGFGSALNSLHNGDPSPTGAVWPEDLFRYDQNFARSLTTALAATAYFSLDGATALARFNQSQNGDFGDWYSPGGQTPEVQDAFATQGSTPVLGVEIRVMDVIGYNRVIPPVTIIASAGSGGGISPSGATNKNAGASQLFTATPNTGATVNQWLLDGSVAQAGGASYTLANLQTDHTVQVTFNQPPPVFGGSSISGGKFQTTLSGLSSGENVVLYVSTNLTAWLPVQTNVASGPTLSITNTVPPGNAIQYFRAILQ